jgi:hypothetical protein
MKLYSSVLAGLTGFVGVGATVGAVLVVPSLPAVMYRYGGFSNDLVPAVGLGIVGIISLAAACGVLARKRNASLLAFVAGSALIVFKLVEAFAVGNVFSPPAGIGAAAYVLVWLQPLFIAIGLAIIVLAARSNSEPSGGR